MRAKTRLGSGFGKYRSQLALAFARDTVAAATRCSLVAEVTVTTRDPVVAASFVGTGVHVFQDGVSDDLNIAISCAIREEDRLREAERIAVLLGDLPALTSSALELALELAESREVAFVPDAKGSGTTLLCTRSPAAVRPFFGVGSAATHEAVGAVPLRDPRMATLRHDVDDLADLLAALQLGVGEHTGQILRHLGWPADGPAAASSAKPFNESSMVERLSAG